MPAFDLATRTTSGSRGVHPLDDREQLVGAVAAVAADSVGAPGDEGLDRLLGRHAHHRVAAGVEGHRGDQGDARGGAPDALDGGLDLVEVGHRLDPDEVDAAGDERRGLLAEDVDGDRRSRACRAARRSRRSGRCRRPRARCPPAASHLGAGRIAAVRFSSSTRRRGRAGPSRRRLPPNVLVMMIREPASR